MAGMSNLLGMHPVDISTHLQSLPEDASVPFTRGWRWLHTLGHFPGHVSLWREAGRALIAGDAVVTTAAEFAYGTVFQAPELHGPPKYFTIDWVKSRASVEALAHLRPNLLITGHGRAMAGGEMTDALSVLAREFNHVSVPADGRFSKDVLGAHPLTRTTMATHNIFAHRGAGVGIRSSPVSL
jgi:glyoxylase-like metal-dependent hydrolase (beta-lactamase superfamily II)